MDYYEPTVEKYIASDRRTFISTQFWIPLPLPTKSDGGVWVDAIAINIRDRLCHLCETTFARDPKVILNKINIYNAERERIRFFLQEQAGLPAQWELRPWLFLLRQTAGKLIPKLAPGLYPKIIYLEYTAPWFYPN